ncbi:MAG: hypothetical protein ACE5G2_11330 [Candidatus Krumholzibacteriia bacterium]
MPYCPGCGAEVEATARTCWKCLQPLTDEEDAPDPEAAAPKVVAYVAQDEVQAEAISQLLSDCGIESFPCTEEADDAVSVDEPPKTRVEVMAHDLEAARCIIEDFTAQFEEDVE